MKNINDEQRAFMRRMQIIMDKEKSTLSFCNKHGLIESKIRKYLKDGTDPSRQSLVQIANAAGVSVQWLATGRTPEGETAYLKIKQEINEMKKQIKDLEMKLETMR